MHSDSRWSLAIVVVMLVLTMPACGWIDPSPPATPLPDMARTYVISINCVATYRDGVLRMGATNYERDASGSSALLALWLDTDDDTESLYEKSRVHAGDVITYRHYYRVQVLSVNADEIEVAVGEVE